MMTFPLIESRGASKPVVRNAAHGDLVALLTRRQGARACARRSPSARWRCCCCRRCHCPGLQTRTGVADRRSVAGVADTILPGGRPVKTDLGNPIHPLAIAGVDPLPGAVEADALAFDRHPEVGFDAVAPASAF